MVGCSARERDGLHVPCRLESRWGTPERGRGGQKLPGDLASSVQSPESGRQRQRKWEDCTWCILKLGPTLPQEGKPGAGATEPGRRDGEQGEGPGVSAASSAALLAPLPGPTPGTRLRPLLWQLQGSWLREVLRLRLWKVRGLITAHGSSGRGPPW